MAAPRRDFSLALSGLEFRDREHENICFGCESY